MSQFVLNLAAASKPHTAIVVGGSSGIGLATVKCFLRKGVQVVIADVNDKLGLAAEKDLRAKGLPVTFIKCSVTDSASLVAMIEQAASLCGTIEYAVNTAGINGPSKQIVDYEDHEWDMVMGVDLEGNWRFAKAIVKFWRTQEPRLIRNDHEERPEWDPVYQRGSLVNVSSALGSVGKAYLGVYSAAKHGVIGLAKTLALENADWGIRVNTISPGLTLTPIMQEPGFDYEMAKTVYLSDQPMARFAHPDEIASCIVFTAMDGASFMTGCDWGPDGGTHVA